jgi:hypothetical protein
MKTRTQKRDGLQPTPWIQSILGRIGPNPLSGGPAWPALPDRICGVDPFADALVIAPQRRPEAACPLRDDGEVGAGGSSREGTAMKTTRFTTVAAVLVAVLALTAVVLLAGCGKEAGDVTTPTLSNLAAENTQGSPTDVDAVMSRLATASPAEAEAIWNGLSEETQKAVSESQKVAPTDQQGVVAPDGRGSSSVTGSYTMRGALGQVLWTYYHRINWTYNGIRVTAVTYDDNGYASVQSPFWTYEGFVPPKLTPFTPPCVLYTSKVIGRFSRHLYPGGPVVETRFAWVRDWAFGTGRGSWDSGVQ